MAAERLGDTGTGNVVTGANIHGLTVSNTTLGVWLSNAADTTVEDVEMANKPTTGTGYKGPLEDGGGNIVGASTQPGGGLNLAYYATSSTYPPGSTSPVTTTITTDSGTPSIFYELQLLGIPFASLPSTAPNGTIVFCMDCLHNNAPCAGGGPGALALKVSSTVWACD